MGREIIVVDSRQIDKLAMELKGFEKEVGTALKHALNRTISSVMTATAREVSKVYNIKQSEIKLPGSATKKDYKNAILAAHIKAPSDSDLSAHIEFTGRTLTMMHFGITPNEKFPVPNLLTKERPVKVKIMRSGGYKKIKSDPKPFVFKFPTNKKLNVWKRIGKKFTIMEPIRTLSVPQMITNEDISKQIMKAAEETLGKRLEHEIIRSMTSIKQKVGGA